MYYKTALSSLIYVRNMIKPFMKRIYQRLISIGGKNFVGIIINTIGVLSFLIGINFFISEPSLKVTIHKSQGLLDSNLLYRYYVENSIKIPEEVKKPLISEQPLEIEGVGENSPLINKIKFFDKSEDAKYLEKYLEGQSKEIQDDLMSKDEKNNKVFHPPMYMGTQIDSLCSEVLPKLKDALSASDYFKLMVGVKSSLKYRNTIIIENDGNIDLKNIDVVIPFPFSQVYGTRDTTFVKLWPNSINSFHSIDISKSSLSIRLPSLKMNNSISELFVFTTEYPIFENEIIKTYDKDFSINKMESLKVGVAIFITFLSLYCFWGNRPDLQPLRPRDGKDHAIRDAGRQVSN